MENMALTIPLYHVLAIQDITITIKSESRFKNENGNIISYLRICSRSVKRESKDALI